MAGGWYRIWFVALFEGIQHNILKKIGDTSALVYSKLPDNAIQSKICRVLDKNENGKIIFV